MCQTLDWLLAMSCPREVRSSLPAGHATEERAAPLFQRVRAMCWRARRCQPPVLARSSAGALAQGRGVMSNVPVASCLLTRRSSGVMGEQLPRRATALNPAAHLSPSGSTSLGFASNIKGLAPLTGAYIKRVHITESTLKLVPTSPHCEVIMTRGNSYFINKHPENYSVIGVCILEL